MLSNERLVRVQWGDCDPAGIVYYPRYFEWVDASTILLFEKATRLTKIKMLERYGGAGLALLEARAVFKAASQFGDDLTIESRVSEFRRTVFLVVKSCPGPWTKTQSSLTPSYSCLRSFWTSSQTARLPPFEVL